VKYEPCAEAMGRGSMSAWADQEWKTWARSWRRTSSSLAAVAPVRVSVMVPVSYRVRGKPRSTEEVAGSGQREVTTLPRV
jgi:hypothetical protein